ncbi:putative F-box domain-containing protein [Medicago truncatula]|uniref:Putative F-box domain-containing protein n=1 Tax=Medicago truncatula TaxID=3880 RepID=A0A396JL41_MEDTR|nr:putative F-box domain-containing protein [Medicago truncatula]
MQEMLIMKKNNIASRISIQDLFFDILIRISLKLNVVELLVASMVCKSWNEICRNHFLWTKLDLAPMLSIYPCCQELGVTI